MILEENIGLEMKFRDRNRTIGFQMDPRKGNLLILPAKANILLIFHFFYWTNKYL